MKGRRFQANWAFRRSPDQELTLFEAKGVQREKVEVWKRKKRGTVKPSINKSGVRRLEWEEIRRGLLGLLLKAIFCFVLVFLLGIKSFGVCYNTA